MADKVKKVKYTGIQKIAIILSQFPSISPNVLAHFDKDDRDAILKEILTIGMIPQDTVNEVMDDFVMGYTKNALTVAGGPNMVKDMLTKIYDESTALEILAQLNASIEGAPLQSLKKIDSDQLINFLRGSRPSLIALMLCYLGDINKAAKVLGSLDNDKRLSVIQSISAMGEDENSRVSEDVVGVLQEYVDKNFSASMFANKSNKIGGLDTVVQMMNQVDMKTEESIMTGLDELDPILSETIRKRMFTFDDFIKLSERDLELVLREEINDTQLAMCLVKCNEKIREELQEKFLKCMSSRKANMIREEMDNIDRVKFKDLEEARQNITNIAKKLQEKGLIVIGNNSEEFV